MENSKQRNKFKITNFLWRRYFYWIFYASICCLEYSSAHFIHIDHNEFRAHGYPRPPLPPPLPPVDQLHHQQLPIAKELTPVEFMVDLTNDLTYRILHYHSILNRNNFAFSPTALMSVLVALYEGSTGRSATEVRNVLQLPNNRDIIRVGYRDIHRRLRTYFFGSDNPLKGLSLNKDNVTITRDYETILMFYGYDLGIDMVSSTMPPTTTTTTTEPTIPDASASASPNATTAVPITTTAETDKNGEASSITEAENEESSSTTEAGTTNAPPPTTTSTTTEPPQTTTESATEKATTTTTEETSSEMETTTKAAEETTTEASSTEAPADDEKENGGAKTNGEAAELVSSFVAVEDAEPLLRIQKARVTRLPSSKLQVPLVKIKSLPQVNYLPSSRQVAAITTGGRGRSRSRYKRHLYSGFKELDANLFVTLFNQQTSSLPHHHQHQGLFSITGPESASIIATTLQHNEFDGTVDIEPSFIGAGGAVKQNYNTDIISHVFYLNSQQIVHTTFKVYNAVLYYKYFENLKMHALELELNTPEYNLIILLPDFNTDLVTAAASLRLGPTLRLMRKELKPRWVQAIIPDFKLHGTMFLTNDLQNMGICDVFEPNRADFRPMTDEKGIYVKHIEQSINVNIRTRPINQLRRNTGQQTQPIQISVNHPFLFFIIDRDLDAAVMAGRILNPLNVRIQ